MFDERHPLGAAVAASPGVCAAVALRVGVRTTNGRGAADAERSRQARVDAAQARLAALVEQLQTGEDWRRALATAARFHRYSFGNAMLIVAGHGEAYTAGLVPDPVPDFVAGFRTWLALGRRVDRGQHGYPILRPATRNVREARDRDGQTRALQRGEQPAPGEVVESHQALVGWSTATVFARSQTSGADLALPPQPRLLPGDAPPGLWAGLARQVAAAGYALGDVPDATAIAGANGLTRFSTRTVLVRADMEPAARVKTLAHELGHVLLHGPAVVSGETAAAEVTQGVREVEAESVAFVVAAAHDLDTSAYSLPYVTSWAGGDDPAAVVRSTAVRVTRAARSILDGLPTVQVPGGPPPGAADPVARRSGPAPTAAPDLPAVAR
jgi:hypothetical protein